MAILYAQDWRDYDAVRKVFKAPDRDGELEMSLPIDGNFSFYPDASSNDPFGPAFGSSSQEIRFVDREYPTGSFFKSLAMTKNATTPHGYTLRFANASDAIKKAALSFITVHERRGFGISAFAVGLSREVKPIDGTNSASSYGSSGLFLRHNDQGFLEVVSVIQTTTTAVNTLIIATGPRLIEGNFYHVEIQWDITTSLASCVVFLNGEQTMSVTFDRDRIVNGREDSTLEMLKFYSLGSNMNIANIVVYTPDAETPFPLGVMEVGRISPNQGTDFEQVRYNPNASDASWSNLTPGQERIWPLSDITDGFPILHAELRGRVSAGGGFTPAVLETELMRPDGSLSVGDLTSAPPSSYERMIRKKIPAEDASIAALNAARIAVRARLEN